MNLSTIVEKFIKLQNDSLTLLQGLSNSVISNNDSVSVDLEIDGELQKFQIPSIGYLKRQIDGILNKIDNLTGKNGQIMGPDGKFLPILREKNLDEPEPIKEVLVPKYFFVETNWFLEDLMIPKLNVKFDISNYVPQEESKIFYKRIIIPDGNELIENNYLNKNQIDYEEFIKFLELNNIKHVVDDNYKDLPYSIVRYSGEFTILKIEIRGDKSWYRLNTNKYNDNVSNIKNGETLKIGDELKFNGSIFKIDEIDEDFYRLTIIRGTEFPYIGDNLSFNSKISSVKTCNIAIQPNEYNVIFFKSINDESNIISTKFSKGVCFRTNSLINRDTNDTLELFYKNNVLDLGKYLLGLSKEKPVAKLDAIKPLPPILNKDNFKIVLLNEHKLNQDEILSIETKQRDKIRLESEIKQLNIAIKQKTLELNSTNFSSDTEKKSIKNQLDELVREYNIKSSQYSTIIEELNVLATQKPKGLDTPKYRIRGFFEIPKPVLGDTGNQNVIQFKIVYRYVSPAGESKKINQLEFIDSNGNKRQANFSNWNEIFTKIRKKVYSNELGVYIWENENIEDANIVNINQIDIPISKGEKVEFYVVAISEAGWPLNPMESDPSEIISIEFPDNLNTENVAENALEQSKEEKLLLKLQRDLSSRGLDEHLSDSFNTKEKYFAHTSENISSGFFTPEGNVISLYEKLKELQLKIIDLENRLNKTFTPIKVFIIDEKNNSKIEVKNGDTINLFAGYYKDLVQLLPPSARRGAIINSIWKIQLLNDQSTPLQLIARLPGGIQERLPDSDSLSVNDADYKNYRKYDKTPIVNTSISKKDTNNSNPICSSFYQSGQLRGQFLYSRYTDIGLVNNLYQDAPSIPGRKLLPIQKNIGQQEPWVWNFLNISAGDSPQGNGYLSNFCIHIQHPLLNEIDKPRSLDSLQKPKIQLDNSSKPISDESTSAFIHSYGFNEQGNINKPAKQLSYRNNWDSSSYTSGSLIMPNIEHLPDKFGFVDNDRYLIGKNTCGAYLYLAPTQIDTIMVDGVDARAKREVFPGENNSIIIPVIFQFRMTDYFGPSIIDENTLGGNGIIGGYDENAVSEPKNLTYVRRIGIDLYQLDASAFSFDIQVSATYQKESSVQILDAAIPPRIKKLNNITIKKLDIKKIF